MVSSGTHALDIVMWMMEGKHPVEIYARCINKALGHQYHGIDATSGVMMFSDGSIYQATISWALPVTWPGAVYILDIGIVGTEGVLTIDDTHRDIVLATTKAQSEGYAPDESRRVDFWVATRPATSRWANCAVPGEKKPNPGLTAFRSVCRPSMQPPPKLTTA